MKTKNIIKFLSREKLVIHPHGIIISVKKKELLTELGTTEYTFSYSFKGDMLDKPIDPYQLLGIAQDMTEIIRNNGQTLIALDRGGTALGVAVSIVSKMPLHIAFSYFTTPPKGWISWEEKGAGKSLAIPPLQRNTHVILIDDEINTGLTYVDAIKALESHGVYVDQIIVVAEVSRKRLGRDVIQRKYKKLIIDSLYVIPEPIYIEKYKNYVFMK